MKIVYIADLVPGTIIFYDDGWASIIVSVSLRDRQWCDVVELLSVGASTRITSQSRYVMSSFMAIDVVYPNSKNEL